MDKNYCGPMRFAHTGVANLAPENSLEAFIAAVQAGCEGIEMDINMTKDGEIICTHGPCLAALTDGKVMCNISDLTLDEARAIDIPYRNRLLPQEPPYPWSEHDGGMCFKHDACDPENRVTHLITFEEFDRWLSEQCSDILIEVEFKTTGMMPRMMQILQHSENIDQYIFFSGEDDVLEEMQNWYRTHKKPEGLRLGANIRFLNEKTMAFIRSSDLYEVGLNCEAFTRADVDMLAKMGVKVFSNLGDYPEWWAKLYEYGVTGFKTNYVAAYTRWAKQRKK